MWVQLLRVCAVTVVWQLNCWLGKYPWHTVTHIVWAQEECGPADVLLHKRKQQKITSLLSMCSPVKTLRCASTLSTDVLVRQVDCCTARTGLCVTFTRWFGSKHGVLLSLLSEVVTWWEVSNIKQGALCWSKQAPTGDCSEVVGYIFCLFFCCFFIRIYKNSRGTRRLLQFTGEMDPWMVGVCSLNHALHHCFVFRWRRLQPASKHPKRRWMRFWRSCSPMTSTVQQESREFIFLIS